MGLFPYARTALPTTRLRARILAALTDRNPGAAQRPGTLARPDPRPFLNRSPTDCPKAAAVPPPPR